MRIAVTYENGNVFQAFRKKQNFSKVYEVKDGQVISSEVIGSNGAGHGALAGLLAGQGVDVLICGGLGGGAQAALAEAGVEVCAGAQGNTDQVVDDYLKGQLVSTGANCDHHHEEGHSCGGHEEGHDCGDHGEGGSCGSGCGGCGGGCGSQPALIGRNVGKNLPAPIIGEPSTMERSLILLMTAGSHWNLSAEPGQMIRGFDAAVADMEVGQVVDVHLMPEEAYGHAGSQCGADH